MPSRSKRARTDAVMRAERVGTLFGAVASEDFARARVTFLPVEYDATTSYRPGARDGPRALLAASAMIEEIWGGEWGADEWHSMVEDQFFHTGEPALVPLGRSTKEHLESVALAVAPVVRAGKIPFLLGGEHSLTFASLSALYAKYKDFSILQFDAHTDLRNSYLRDPYSHACVMRRCFELGPKVSITSVGIRSEDLDGARFIREQQKKNSKQKSLNVFWAPEMPVDAIDATLKERVYISFDLDAFDPSIMPAVGTPQPGGLGWYQVLEVLERVIARHQIIGLDVVELAPIPGMVAPDFLAAKLVWNMLVMLYDKRLTKR